MSDPTDIAKLKTEIWEDARNSYRDEYKDLAETWSKLDQKAQGIVTIAGIFLAAVFAASRGDAVPSSSWDRISLAGSIILLVASVFASGIALRVRRTVGGPDASQMERAAEDMDEASSSYGDLDDLRVRFLRTQINAWRRCTSDLRANNESKARSVRTAQFLLFVGVIFALGVTLHILAIGPSRLPK